MLGPLVPARLRALIFDVDGTLYRQRAVRFRMLARLAARTVLHPVEMAPVWKVLPAYRRAQESLRAMQPNWSCIAEEQMKLACRSSGLDRDAATRSVAQWMDRAPLDLLPPAMYDDVEGVLRTAKQQGLLLAVWSDYPAAAKLEAMGLNSVFDVVVCAQDPAVQRFKPDPRGMEVLLRRLGVAREEVLYVGDRLDVDGEAAARAGVAFFHAGRRSYRELKKALNGAVMR